MVDHRFSALRTTGILFFGGFLFMSMLAAVGSLAATSAGGADVVAEVGAIVDR